MNLIPCSTDCKYQNDGYCSLERAGAVTGSKHRGCPHYLSKSEKLLFPPRSFDASQPDTRINGFEL